MPRGPVRFQESGDLHFVAFSCFDAAPILEQRRLGMYLNDRSRQCEFAMHLLWRDMW
jgi:hypothetical protein